MAIVRDLFSGAAFARLFSRLMLVMGAAPILAPTLGGAVLRWTQWRGVFVALAVFGVLCSWSPCSRCPRRCRRTGAAAAGRSRACGPTGRCCATGRSSGLVFVAGLGMAALFAYVSGSSFVFQDQYGLGQQEFGWPSAPAPSASSRLRRSTSACCAGSARSRSWSPG